MLSSCVYDKEFTYLNDQIIDLNRRVKNLQETIDKKLESDLDSKLKTIHSNQAELEWTDSAFSFTDPQFRGQWEKSLKLYTQYLNNPFFEASQYDIVVRAVSTSKSFRLDALNIVENSEKVTLDGRTLSRGSDYTINYDTGEECDESDPLAFFSELQAFLNVHCQPV